MPNTGIDNSQTLHQIKAKHCIKPKPNTATYYSQTLQHITAKHCKKFLKHLGIPIYYRIFASNSIDNRHERIQKENSR